MASTNNWKQIWVHYRLYLMKYRFLMVIQMCAVNKMLISVQLMGLVFLELYAINQYQNMILYQFNTI